MHYITDYQLDINKGFMCKVNGKTFKCEFLISNSAGKHFYISNILRVADAMGIARQEFTGIFNNDYINHVIYCDSRQQCYDLCLHIVKTYFRPKQTETDKKEWCEKSRRYLTKYYADDESYVIFNNVQWNLISDQKRNMWYFYNAEHGYHIFFRQFGIKDAKEAIAIGSKLGLLVKFTTFKLEFESRHDAIKFTDYLIETYIIKKEKTYDTNQLRKERTAISRGAKPAGSIIHGRRSKASVRCGCIEHKACLGN